MKISSYVFGTLLALVGSVSGQSSIYSGWNSSTSLSNPTSSSNISPTSSSGVSYVNCKVNGVTVATVNLETGVCPFKLPDDLTAEYDFVSFADYFAEFYYSEVSSSKYYTDIINKGLTINIPAAIIYANSGAHVFQVIADSNSTSSLEKRASEQDTDEFLAYLKTLTGTELPIILGAELAVNQDVSSTPMTSSGTTVSDSTLATNSGSNGITLTSTDTSTVMITVTSCSDNKCSKTTIPATPTLTTETKNGETTVYTTYFPITTKSVSTKMITITSCSDNKCSQAIVPATPTLTTELNNGEKTVYTTYCPISDTTDIASTTTISIKSCFNNKCSLIAIPATPSVTTITTEGQLSVLTTYCPVSESNEYLTTLTNGLTQTKPVTIVTESSSSIGNTLSLLSSVSTAAPKVIVPESNAASTKSSYVLAYFLLSMIPFLI